MSGVPTPFPELNELLTELVERQRDVLGDDLVGAYLTGGFALGAGDLSSDCDFLVVTAESVTPKQERGLRTLHDEIPSRPGYWAINLEGSYAPLEDLRTLDALGREWLEINRGWREMEWSTHCNQLDVRWVLREHGVVLAGPEPRAFACEVPSDLLREQARGAIDSFLPDLLEWAEFTNTWTQRYTVETLCRLLYTLESGEVASKHRSLEWALTALEPEWHDLIRQAIADRLVTWNDPPRPGSVEAAQAFAEHAKASAAERPA